MNITKTDNSMMPYASPAALLRRQKPETSTAQAPSASNRETPPASMKGGAASIGTSVPVSSPVVIAKPAVVETGAVRDPAQPHARPSGAERSTTHTRTPLTLEELQSAFGTKNTRCDLDGNGIVDMDDLVAFIARQNAAAETDTTSAMPHLSADNDPNRAEATPSEPPVPPTLADSTTGEPTRLDIAGFQKAWGENGTPYDLNNDGTVNMDDLVQFIASGGTSGVSASGPSVPDRASTTGNSIAPTNARPKPVRTEHLVDLLVNRLNQAGFTNQPPTNIRELVDALDLSPSQTNAAIRQLRQHYPAGLGVNLVG